MQKYKSFMRNITGSQITCFWTSTFKQCILTINQFKELYFDRKCKVQLSDENKTLIDKSMYKEYRKYKCCGFIDFEYSWKLKSSCLWLPIWPFLIGPESLCNRTGSVFALLWLCIVCLLGVFVMDCVSYLPLSLTNRSDFTQILCPWYLTCICNWSGKPAEYTYTLPDIWFHPFFKDLNMFYLFI